MMRTDILISNPQGRGDISNLIADYKIWRDHQKFYNKADFANVTCDRIGIPCFHYLDIDQINACPNPFIIINNLTESLHSAKWFRKYRLDRQYLILSSGQWESDQIDWSFDYVNINFNWFLLEMADTYLSSRRFCFYLEKDYIFGPKPWIFISTTGTARPERSLLIDSLKRDISYTNFNIRYNGKNIGMDHALDVVDMTTEKFDPYTSLLEQHYHNISQTLPLNWYNQAYVNLVVETDIDYQHSFFLTEKTIKCLITGMPFVVYATPFFLQNLHALGFRSYGDFWDEGYDLETDMLTRVKKIVDLMNRLKEFDWSNHFADLAKIAAHNRTTFFRLNHLTNSNFETLHQYLSSAWYAYTRQS